MVCASQDATAVSFQPPLSPSNIGRPRELNDETLIGFLSRGYAFDYDTSSVSDITGSPSSNHIQYLPAIVDRSAASSSRNSDDRRQLSTAMERHQRQKALSDIVVAALDIIEDENAFFEPGGGKAVSDSGGDNMENSYENLAPEAQ